MEIMDKAMIETWILPHLTICQRGFETTVALTEVVECIFHRLKTGCQWRELPTKQFFSDKVLNWNSVFYYYNIANVKENPRNSASQEQEPYQSRKHVFDDELYEDRSVIEHANAWIDGFKALLVRFEFSVKNWMSLHFIAFSVIFLRKINRKRKV